MTHRCGKCDGCMQPPHLEDYSRALRVLCDWFQDRIQLSDEDVAKTVRLVERDRWAIEVLEQAYLKGECRFPDMSIHQSTLAAHAWRRELRALAQGGPK